jgi:hypothetical protein
METTSVSQSLTAREGIGDRPATGAATTALPAINDEDTNYPPLKSTSRANFKYANRAHQTRAHKTKNDHCY